MRHALYVPPFGPLAAPGVLLDVAVAAEQAGWDGMFLWDHLLRPEPGAAEVLDAWTTVAAMAAVTTTIRVGPMVTPLPRRRPQTLARAITTVDLLSAGRLTVGFGLGTDHGGELSAFGEEVDPGRRGAMLDEGLELVVGLISGDDVAHRGEVYTADGVRFLPPPHQSPRPPFWLASRSASGKPIERAARYDGVFPISVDADGVEAIAGTVAATRGSLDGFDIAVIALPGMDVATYERAGATWAMWTFLPGATPDEVAQVTSGGPERLTG